MYWKSSIHVLKDRLLHITGKEDQSSNSESLANIVFLFYERSPPFNLVLTKSLPKGHFNAATVVFDKRGEEVGREIWAFVVLITVKANQAPYKLVKLNYERLPEQAAPNFAKDESFRNCTIIENDRIMLFTS